MTATNTLLRRAEVRDAADLHRTCWPERDEDLIAEFLQRCLRLAEKGRTVVLVVEKNGEVVGFGLLTKWPNVAEVSDLVVSPQLRGNGIGSILIDHLGHKARQLGCTMLEIGAAHSNPRAIALYQRLGFTPQRTVEVNLGAGPEPVTYLIKPL